MAAMAGSQGIKILIAFRLLLTLIFLGATIWIHYIELRSALQPTLYPFYGIIILVSALTILYSLILKLGSRSTSPHHAFARSQAFTYAQFFIDTLIITLIVFFTGGVESPLIFLYILSIIGGSMLLGRKGGLIVSSVNSLSYGLLVDLQFYRAFPWTLSIAPSIPNPDSTTTFYNLFITIAAFFAVALLIGYLAEKVKKAEKALDAAKVDYRRLETLSRNIIENINSGIMTIDTEGRITSFNRAAERITGFSLRDVYLKGVTTIFPAIKYQDLSRNRKGMRREEMVFRRKDGRELFLGFSISPLKEEGKDSGTVMIFQDMTRLKKMEEEARRNERLRALGELAAGIAHEIRNPLASISGSIQVLKEDLKGLDEEDRRLMDIILAETERLNSLIADFLVFARPAPKKQKTSLKALAEDTLKLLSSRRDLKDIEVIKELEDVTALVDPQQMKQVFWNLFLNAVEAMGGKGQLRVKIGRNGAGRTEIVVSDTGKGVSPGYGERIFDPFFTTKEMGTGIGLAVVYRIIEGHNGTIEFESKEGEGTTFRITL